MGSNMNANFYQQILTETITVFWDVTSYSLVDFYQTFGRSSCLDIYPGEGNRSSDTLVPVKRHCFMFEDLPQRVLRISAMKK